ncbi:MAG: MBG domain-containing protein, partial [Planctomycetota bacterium]
VTSDPKTKTYDGGLYTDSFNSTLGGLTAEYYRNKDLTGSPHIKRVDSTIDNNWGGGGPTGLGVNDRFSVRWTGSVLPQYTQTYTFTTRTDDGVRLWVNGILLINRWSDFAPTNHSGNIALVAGQYATIKMEYYENGGGAVAQLYWSSASQAKQIVPSSKLATNMTNPASYTSTITGYMNGETASVITGSVSYTGAATTARDAGPYAITPVLTALSAANYSFAKGTDSSLVINKALVTVTAEPKTKAYNVQTFTAFTSLFSGFTNNETTSVLSGTVGYVGAATTATNAGSYTITPTTTALVATNYSFASVNGTLSITKAVLTVTADAKGKSFNGQTFTGFSSTMSGFATGDSSSIVTGTVSYAGAAVSAKTIGAYTITPIVANLVASNYSFVAANGTLAISAAAASTPSLTWNTPADITYGTALSATQLNATSGGVAGSFVYSPALGTVLKAGAAQTLTVTFIPTNLNSYKAVSNTVSINVNKAVLTVAANFKGKNNDGQTYSAFTSSITGFVNGDNSSAISGAVTYTGTATTASSLGIYIITPVVSGLTAANYSFATLDGTLAISHASAVNPSLTWAAPASIVYGTALSATQLNATSSVPGTFSYIPAIGTILNAGMAQTLLVTFTPNDLTAYNAISKTVVIDVTKAVVTITANAQAKTFNGLSFTGFTSTYSGLVAGDTTAAIAGAVIYSGTAVGAMGAGSYVITPVLTSLSSSNYSLVAANGTLTINKAVLTVTAGSKGKTADGSAFTAFTNVMTGFANGDGASVVSGSVGYTGAAVTATAVGAYTVMPDISKLKALNYTFITVSGTLAISSPAAVAPDITWPTPAAITYGTALSAAQLNATSAVAGTFSYSQPAGTVMPAGTTQILSVIFTPTDLNTYKPVTRTVSMVVNKATLTVIADTTTKIYNGQPATGFTSYFAGLVNGDNPSVVSGGVAYVGTATTGVNVGSYVITPVVTALSAANYTFAPADGTLIIAKATLVVTANDASKINDGQTYSGFTSTITGYVNGENSSKVTGTVGFTGPALTATAVGATSISPDISGLSAANYTFVAVSGTLAISSATAANPGIVWAEPFAITYGTAISDMQLNAISTVDGAFSYSIPEGTVLNAGAAQAIIATFTPYDLVAYKQQSVTVNLNVNKAVLTVTASAKTKTYNGQVFTGYTSTITGLVNGDSSLVIGGSVSYSGTAITATAAGSYVITPSVSGLSATNYSFDPISSTLTIAKATLTVIASDKGKTSDGSVFTGYTNNIYGYANNETSSVITGSVTYTGTAITATAVGAYPITPVITSLTATNYVFVATSGTLAINAPAAATPTITWSTPLSITYGTALTSKQLNASSGSVIGSYTYNPPLGTVLKAGLAQTLTVTFTPIDLTAHKQVSKTVTIDVSKAGLLVTANNATKQANGQTYTGFTNTITGLVNGDASSVVTGSVTYSGTAIAATTAGSYVITPVISGLTASNYTITAANGTLAINGTTAVAPTVAWPTPSSISYGTPLSEAQLNATSTVPGTFTYSPALGSVLRAGMAQTLTVMFIPTDLVNYKPTTATVAIDVSTAILTVTADARGKTYNGSAFSNFTSTITGYVNGDNGSSVFGSITYTDDGTTATNAGTYLITPVIGALSSNDYTFVASSGTVAINKALLAVTADSKTKTYNGQVYSGLTSTVTGFVNSETSAVLSGTIVYTGGSATAAGVYTITPDISSLSAANYEFIVADGTLTINKATLKVTANNATKNPDGSPYSGVTTTITGFVNSENSSVISGSATFTGAATTATALGAYAITPVVSGMSAANYKLVGADGTLFIGTAPSGSGGTTVVTVTWANPGSITYGTALSSTQMNASTSVPGSFSYYPSLGTVLNAGLSQSLTVTFTPNDMNTYAIATKTVSVDVLKKALTVTADPQVKKFDSEIYPTANYTSTISGLVNGDTSPGISSGTVTYSGNALTATALGTYTIVATSTLVSNDYTFTTVDGSLTIKPLTVDPTLTWQLPTAIVYGDPLSNTQLNATASVTGMFTYTPGLGTMLNAGLGQTLSLVFTPDDLGSYNVVSTAVTIDILKAVLTVTANPVTKIYNGLTYTAFSNVITGYVYGENSSVINGNVTYSGAATTAIDVGTTTITPVISALSASNYTFASVDSTLTINKALLTVTADARTKTYDGHLFSNPYTNTITGFANGETTSVISGAVTYSGNALTTLDSGTSTITPVISALSAKNYYFTAVDGVQTINKATITVTANPLSKTYTGLTQTGYSSSLTGFVNREPSFLVTGSVVYTGSAVTATNAGTYTITPVTTGLAAINYVFVAADGDLTINKANLNVNAVAKSKTYDGATFTAFTNTITGYVNSETSSVVSGAVAWSGEATTAINAGLYTITPDVSGFSASNYNFVPVTAKLTINKAVLTVTADDKTKTYNGAKFTAFTSTYSGFVNGESALGNVNGAVSYIGSATTSTASGTYAITPIISALSATNYSFTAAPNGTLTVNKALITATADLISKTYNGLVFTAFTTSYTGFVNGETTSVITGSPTYVGAATMAINAGTTTITPVVSALTATNYIFAAADGTLTINKALVTVTADDQAKTYDGQVFTGYTNTISGLVNNETTSVINGTIGYSGASIAAVNANTYTISPVINTLTATNYIFTGVDGTLTINKALLNVSAEAKSKSYNGQVFTAFTNTITGYVNNETSSVVTGSVTYSGAANSAINAGTYTITPVTSALGATNYDFAAVDSTLTVNKVALTVTASNQTKTYDGRLATTFGNTITGFVNNETTSVVGGFPSYTGTATTLSGAGTHTITPVTTMY